MKNEIEIRLYNEKDENEFFSLIEREGQEWKDYWKGAGKEKYKVALASSIVYLLFNDEQICGFIRCRDDNGFGLYVYDLLVDKRFRGNEYGRRLMEKVCDEYPNETVYVMSDVDTYYKKLGYEAAGTIFIVTNN